MIRRESNRPAKLNQEIRKRIARALPEVISWHDEIGSACISVTDVKMSPDMRSAKVMVTSVNNKDNIIDFLASIRVQIQDAIKKNSHMKFVPKLFFILDKRMERNFEVLKVIESINHPLLEKSE